MIRFSWYFQFEMSSWTIWYLLSICLSPEGRLQRTSTAWTCGIQQKALKGQEVKDGESGIKLCHPQDMDHHTGCLTIAILRQACSKGSLLHDEGTITIQEEFGE